MGPCVYLARSAAPSYAGESLWKIGSSVSVRRRLSELDLGPYQLVAFIPFEQIAEARVAEKDVHSRCPCGRAGPTREYYRSPR